jgi:two-component system nitrogen regulation sensor histidine kinase GlnL
MTVFEDTSLSGLPIDALNALPHPVFVLSKDGNFEIVNAAAEAFFRTSFTVLKNRTFGWFLPDGSPMRTLVEQVQKSHSPISEYKVDVSSPRLGEERFVDIYVAPVVERPDSVVVLLQVRSMADTLDKQLTHRGAARTVTGLASMLAHEIKNPLSGIRGAAQLLETHSDEDDRALTRLITEETDRIVRLVDRMEVFSDDRPIERDPVNVHSVLEHVKTLARSGFAKNVKIIERYDPSLPPVLGNRDQLVQVFLNLVKNACEAVIDGRQPEITLSTAYRPGMSVAAPGSRERISLPIALTVSDNGPGVPEDIQSYMFDPFVSSKQNGSGLGLALVAKLVGDHGGVISCDSQPGKTDFQVLMPMWSQERNG